jgi:hypothetical protein
MKWPDKIAQVFTNPAYAGRKSDRAQYSDARVLQHSGVASILRTGLRVCCPEGINDGSQAIYCLEGVQPRIRPVGHGLIPSPGLTNRPDRGAPIGPNHTVPYGTGSVFAPIPGNKLPGYFHNVPTGQRHLALVREFDSTSRLSTLSKPHHSVPKRQNFRTCQAI